MEKRGLELTEAVQWIEIIAATAIPVAIVVIVVERIMSGKGIGVRAIQFLAIGIIPVVVLILGLEGILEKGAIGALLGALVGYLFSNIGQYDKRKDDNQDA